MSNVGDSVGSRLCWTWKVLIVVERTMSGLVHQERIEEMDRELNKVIEDFDRALNVESFRLNKENGKLSFSPPRDSSFSVVSYRESTARPLA